MKRPVASDRIQRCSRRGGGIEVPHLSEPSTLKRSKPAASGQRQRAAFVRRHCDGPSSIWECSLCARASCRASSIRWSRSIRCVSTYARSAFSFSSRCMWARTEIFSEYAYYSSYSDTWVDHARRYATMAQQRFGLTAGSLVVELASNDGYLLQHFVRSGIPVLGIEPAANVAAAAVQNGVRTLVRFFNAEMARELLRQGTRADLIIGNNVLAQVPDLNDFISGMKILLAPQGVITVEFPHLMRLIENNEFDTIYHEHFSYFSFLTTTRIFAAHGLQVFDVEELPTHGGSLRVYARHAGEDHRPVSDRVHRLREREFAAGMESTAYYAAFEQRVRATKRALLQMLNALKDERKSIVGYGAPGKGNTLLNYCGIRTDYLDYTVDRNPYKHGRSTPAPRSDLPTGTDSRDETGRHPDSSVEPSR